jgi:hypothetical protein
MKLRPGPCVRVRVYEHVCVCEAFACVCVCARGASACIRACVCGVLDNLRAAYYSRATRAQNNANDLKELTPEWYYCSEFLHNRRGTAFGVRQNGDRVSDVVLPPWARGSPELFVELNRAALECDYVSARIHTWIDLVFGYKQQGAEAEAADNVFFHLTYESGAAAAASEDPIQRKAIEAQISCFGQTPVQLFKGPHPARLSRGDACDARWGAALSVPLRAMLAGAGRRVLDSAHGCPVVAVLCARGSHDVFTVDAGGCLGQHKCAAAVCVCVCVCVCVPPRALWRCAPRRACCAVTIGRGVLWCAGFTATASSATRPRSRLSSRRPSRASRCTTRGACSTSPQVRGGGGGGGGARLCVGGVCHRGA